MKTYPYPPDIEAEVSFLSTEQGGRKTQAFSGYRPQFYYDNGNWDADQEYPDVESVFPGQTARALLRFLSPEMHIDRVFPGMEFEIREGAHVVAHGKVTKILNLNASAKASLRIKAREALGAMSKAERAAASQQLCTRLEQQTIWQQAQSILFFAPMAEEPDIWPLVKSALAAGRTVALPRFVAEEKIYAPYQVRDLERDVVTGQFGIREPRESCPKIELNRLDLILVPGVAFDFDGHRLGRGKGYYDRMLGLFEGPACGVAFDEQIVARIPVEPHDVRLSCILTPTRWHNVAGLRAV